MAIHRRAAKRDSNEAGIVDALRQAGCQVLRLSGAGVPDLAVYWPPRGSWVLAEVKSVAGRLTPAQREWGEAIRVWRTIDDALADLGITRRV